MKDSTFVNPAISNAIALYMNIKQNPNDPNAWSFPVMVIRSLVAIYGELDIINPYRTNNEEKMGGFDYNLTKFGFSKENLQKFKDSFQSYMINRQNGVFPNPDFIVIEKYLIDMFCYRKKSVNITAEEIERFKSLLYLSTTQNEIMKEEIVRNTNKVQILDYYWNSKLFLSNHNFQLFPYKKNTLIPEAYNILGYTEENIAQMDEQTLNDLNVKILAFFKIDPEEPNQKERLQQAVSYYKQFGNRITSGNGYVDMLMLLSIIATVMMTLFVITVKVLGG